MSPEWKGNEIAVSGKLTLHLSLNFAQLEEQQRQKQQQRRTPHPAKHFPPLRLPAAKWFYLPVARTTGSLAALFVWLAGASANAEATCFNCADRTRTRASGILGSLPLWRLDDASARFTPPCPAIAPPAVAQSCPRSSMLVRWFTRTLHIKTQIWTLFTRVHICFGSSEVANT